MERVRLRLRYCLPLLICFFRCVHASQGYKKARTFSNIGLYRESSDEMWLMNMVEETFSYLNITKINSAEVQNNGECAFACLNEPMCFSYNLEARASKTGTRVCELLPSDKYNNSDEVIISQKFHHYSIQTPCSREPCQNYGTCVPRYEKNSYVCVCKIGFEGKDCETAVSECNRYKILNDSDRLSNLGRGKKCDKNLTEDWYRFSAWAGTNMPTHCLPNHRCSTDLPGWMDGAHPTADEGVVSRKVCFSGYDNCCYRNITINVRNCSSFFVYRLKPVSYCNSRYCGKS